MDDEATQAFTDLKLALTFSPILALPNYTILFIVKVDACGTGIGVVLLQHDHPIAFTSKGLSASLHYLCMKKSFWHWCLLQLNGPITYLANILLSR